MVEKKQNSETKEKSSGNHSRDSSWPQYLSTEINIVNTTISNVNTTAIGYSMADNIV